MTKADNEGKTFEQQVRRLARARWPQAEFQGSTFVDGKERDGVYETEDNVHFIEATISKSRDKAKEDSKKLFELIKKQQKLTPMKGCRGWFITKHEPTAEQRATVDSVGNRQITTCSLESFQRSLIDVQAYLSARENHFFGSVVDPGTESFRPQVDYVPLDILEKSGDSVLPVSELAQRLIEGGRYVLQGDYGVGKSMTLRQIFFLLRKLYSDGRSTKFPVYINLREHSGQDDPSELIERHARRIGFPAPASLVRAWRAGFCVMILDGFDEITTLGASKRLVLKIIRRESLAAVRRLIEQTPTDSGWIVAGREHFFDSDPERRSALGHSLDVSILTLSEFTDKQISIYLGRVGASVESLPAWLPTRPLFVGYMAARGLFSELLKSDLTSDPVDGWDFLVDRICEREARIAPGLDGPTLRAVLERLASLARATGEGLGPITQTQIRDTFVDICGYEPDNQANLLLQRMPGLGVYRVEEDTRSFVDSELAEICRAGDIVAFIQDPYSHLQNLSWRRIMSELSSVAGPLATGRCARNIDAKSLGKGNLDGALQALKATQDLEVVKADLICIYQNKSLSPPQGTMIEGIFFEGYDFEIEDQVEFRGLTFRDCFFDAIEIERDILDDQLPRFESCMIGVLKGRSSLADTPKIAFDFQCVIEEFNESSATQSAILDTDLDKGQKIVLTILRKLYVQSLSGRRDSALVRGLDLNDRARVPEVMRLLQQHNFVDRSTRGTDEVWIPNRKLVGRARQILAAPTAARDALMQASKALFID